MTMGLTYKQVATQLGMPIGTVYALVKQQRIPHRRFGPRFVRFDRDEIQEWWASHAVAPCAGSRDRTCDGGTR